MISPNFGVAPIYSAVKEHLLRPMATQVATHAQTMSTGPAAGPRPAPIARLQSALKALGKAKGDPSPTLAKIKVDGVAGPATTKAINYAITQKYVVMQHFPRPELTVQHVRQFASGIADAVEGAVQESGGTLPPVATARKASSSGGGGGSRAAASYVPPPEAPTLDRKWVMWIVGGASALLLLSVAAAAAKKRRAASVAA